MPELLSLPTWHDPKYLDAVKINRTRIAADSLYWYMFERWRNEVDLYANLCKPILTAEYAVKLENA